METIRELDGDGLEYEGPDPDDAAEYDENYPEGNEPEGDEYYRI